LSILLLLAAVAVDEITLLVGLLAAAVPVDLGHQTPQVFYL
jgi:hypothetical protein